MFGKFPSTKEVRQKLRGVQSPASSCIPIFVCVKLPLILAHKHQIGQSYIPHTCSSSIFDKSHTTACIKTAGVEPRAIVAMILFLILELFRRVGSHATKDNYPQQGESSTERAGHGELISLPSPRNSLFSCLRTSSSASWPYLSNSDLVVNVSHICGLQHAREACQPHRRDTTMPFTR